MRATLAIVLVLAGCGRMGQSMDGKYDVTMDSPDVHCAGTMQLTTDKTGEVYGTVSLCDGNSLWIGSVKVELSDEARGDLTFELPQGKLPMPGAEVDPNAVMGTLRSSRGALFFLALRHGGRMGKSLGPPTGDTPLPPIQ